MKFPENDLVVNTARAAGKDFDYNDALYAMTGDFSSVKDINDRMRAWEQAVPGLSTKYIPYTYSPLYAALTSSAILNRGTGSPIFVRATTAYVTDFEDLAKNAKSGEIRFTGARRVENLLTFTEDFSNAVWGYDIGGTGTAAKTPNYSIAPDGTTTGCRLVATKGSGFGTMRYAQSAFTNPHTIRPSIWMKSNTGLTQNVTLADGNNTNPIVAIVTTSWQRFSSPVATNASVIDGMYIGALGGSDASIDISIWHPLTELVVGQSNQNPSEYVSVGVLSTPFHGAMVDGVKYYPYQNGNTVTANVVTEAQGAAIPEATLKGYLAEPLSTNAALQSQAFNVTWSPTSVTVTPDTTVAPDGTLTADTLDFTIANSAQISQTIAVASFPRTTTWTFSFWGVAGTQTGIFLRAFGSVTGSAGTNFTLTSTPTRYTTTLDISGHTGVTEYIGFDTQAAAGANAAAQLAGTRIIWGFQLEPASATATSYIPTTTVPVTRNEDMLNYPTSGNALGTGGSAYCEILTNRSSLNAHIISTYNGTGGAPIASSTNNVGLFDSTSGWIESTTPYNESSTTANKVATRWGSTSAGASNGNVSSISGFSGSLGLQPVLYIGGSAFGSANVNIKNVRIWQTQLPDSILKGLTT